MSKPSKTLSNGTMSLRFMQNAQRAKQMVQVEAEKAKVKDEAEWEVAREVREAWAVAQGAQSEPTVTYEASYIPFLFSSDDVDASTSSISLIKAIGRRSFNKDGKEVMITQKEEEDVAKRLSIPGEYPEGRRPVTLSGHGASVFKARKEVKDRPEGPSRPIPVLKMISDESGVGIDLRTARRMQGSASAGFLRPAGIDSPATAPEDARDARRDPHAAYGSKHRLGAGEAGDEREWKKRKTKQYRT